MFITKITLCNMFAYYGQVDIEFVQQDSKNLYCIYGDNGYGKTSFIRCAKILFLGTGLNDGTIPPVIARFSKDNLTPKKFIKGDSTRWKGILNESALNEMARDFYIRFEGAIDGIAFSLKRSWHNVDSKEISERLDLELGNEKLQDEYAQSKINAILPPSFVEFFFFDGEEIENISDNLRTELREKIEEILQIKPLEIILKQTMKYKDELKNDALENKKLRDDLRSKRERKDTIDFDLQNLQERLREIQKDLQDYQNCIDTIEHKKQALFVNSHKEEENLISQKNSLEAKLANIKEEKLKENLKSVIFASNAILIKNLENELATLESSKQKDDIKALQRLLPEIKEISHQETSNRLKDIKTEAFEELIKSIFDSILDSLPQKLESKSFANSYIAIKDISLLRESLIRFQSHRLQQDIASIKDTKEKLQMIQDELDELNSDEYTKIKQESLEAELKETTEKKDTKEKQKTQEESMLKELESQKEHIEREIYNLEQNINTERIDNKLHILDLLHQSIQEYKTKLIAKLREELHILILENYKKLLPNDNIESITIEEDFAIRLQDSDNKPVIVENQSSGQKQILAIAIFWALNRLSNSSIPLIIDTPLSRIDVINRSRIIKEFYKQDSQVIVLPHSGEMGMQEYKFAKPHLAGLYKIDNNKDRGHATIKRANIEDILHYE